MDPVSAARSEDTQPATAPRRFRGARARWLVVLIALWLLALACTFPFDADISEFAQRAVPEHTWGLRLIKLSRYPLHYLVFVVMAGALLYDPVRRQLAWDKPRQRYLVGFGVALAACFGMIHGVKFLVGRARPIQIRAPITAVRSGSAGAATTQATQSSGNARQTASNSDDSSAFDFDLFGNPVTRHDSLPSAHTAQYVLIAALMCLYYPRSAWILVPLAVPASLSRVVQGQHFLSDVIAGAGITLLVVLACYSLLGRAFYPRLDWRQRASAE